MCGNNMLKDTSLSCTCKMYILTLFTNPGSIVHSTFELIHKTSLSNAIKYKYTRKNQHNNNKNSIT